jgi:hypothetical protein
MLSPAVQASVDQIAALVRDAYRELGVDIHDPAQKRAIQATWLMIGSNLHAPTWILSGIDHAVLRDDVV